MVVWNSMLHSINSVLVGVVKQHVRFILVLFKVDGL